MSSHSSHATAINKQHSITIVRKPAFIRAACTCLWAVTVPRNVDGSFPHLYLDTKIDDHERSHK